MAYYVEYTIADPENGEHYEIPVNEKESGYTIPLTETDAEIVDAEQLSARSGVFGASLEEAKEAAEEIITHSKSTKATLYEDPTNSTSQGVGKLVAKYTQTGGWQEA